MDWESCALLLAENGYRYSPGRSAEKPRSSIRGRTKRDCRSKLWKWMYAMTLRAAGGHLSLSESGAIDVLINNAGLAYVATVEDMTMEDWRAVRTNFFGVVRVTQAVLPKMRERRSGRIVMISSVSGLVTRRRKRL